MNKCKGPSKLFDDPCMEQLYCSTYLSCQGVAKVIEEVSHPSSSSYSVYFIVQTIEAGLMNEIICKV